MTDDTLLMALGDEARKRNNADNFDERWERYAAGTLSDSEIDELIASVTEEEAAVLTEAFAPLEESFHEQVSKRLHDEIIPNSGSLKNAPEEHIGEENVVNFVSRKRFFIAPLAVAATLILAIGAWQFGSSTLVQSEIPGYELSLLGGSAFRSETPGMAIPEFAMGDRLEIRLVPNTATQESVKARMYVETEAELLLADEVAIDIAPSGAMRINGRIGSELQLPEGQTDIFVIIGREGELPEFSDISQDLQSKDAIVGNGWQAWRVPISIVPP